MIKKCKTKTKRNDEASLRRNENNNKETAKSKLLTDLNNKFKPNKTKIV